MNVRSFTLYTFVIISIFGWWLAAFRSPQKKQNINSPPINLSQHLDPLLFPSPLSLLNREEIQRALSGELSLMVKLISDWDLDAEILDTYGHKEVKRLPKEAVLRAKLIGRLFDTTPKEELLNLQNAYRLKGIIDDNGALISLQEPFHLFLPQTYVAASCLLSLSDPSQIVAIPKGIREQTELFPPNLTNQIKYDIDRYNGEHFFHVKPQIAFVSHYSNPSTLEALQNQGIQLFAINAVESLSDIRYTLIRIGNAINRPLEAELLTIFMESAMLAIDNRLLALNQNQTILYLNFHTHFSSPSSKTITWQLLDRLNVSHCLPKALVDAHAKDWSIPLNQEQIVNYNPDCLIIATANAESFTKPEAFHSMNARLVFVDETIQQSPSQFVVLAYYDLAKALSNNRLDQNNLSKSQILTTNE